MPVCTSRVKQIIISSTLLHSTLLLEFNRSNMFLLKKIKATVFLRFSCLDIIVTSILMYRKCIRVQYYVYFDSSRCVS